MSSELKFNSEIKNQTSELYNKIHLSIPQIEWPTIAPYIYEINKLKKEKGVTILAHNYQAPEIFYGVADIVGDSLGLAIDGSKVKTDKILMCGVHFMAETAKIMSPEKKILLPDLSAGCSLAESITASDVRKLKKENPGVPVVTYVNTSAAVKAETDICCTSANAVKIVESLNVKKVIFLPDEYLAKYVASKTKVEIISWKGKCEVHERFTDHEIFELRKKYPDLKVVSHPECPPEVINASDYTGSTGSMINYVKNTKAKDIFLVTECSMSDNVQIENPNINFIKPCNLCPHMKKITLKSILKSLKEENYLIEIDDETISRAKGAIEKMIAIGR
ncbi:MAG: quinolinate synthase NadA [Pelagibacteraceae bacterium]|jgi:quinolinate synthase|nr:quinolinate synthase NadA [Pelagibacteraceae bacterium]|tara:strand:- start:857 stop:1858 length:1002 start_codon:yes stop_codon:yes gene_type:complete